MADVHSWLEFFFDSILTAHEESLHQIEQLALCEWLLNVIHCAVFHALDSRFDLAYNAAHSFCLAALRWHGYRPANRYIASQALPHTLGLGPEVWRVLAKCHELRNLGEYEGDLNINERIVSDLVNACRKVAMAH